MTEVAKTVRSFSSCGPCIPLGAMTKQTAQFYCFVDRSGRAGKVRIRTPERYSGAHVEACPSCRDHPKTQYPNGYEN